MTAARKPAPLIATGDWDARMGVIAKVIEVMSGDVVSWEVNESAAYIAGDDLPDHPGPPYALNLRIVFTKRPEEGADE